LSIGWIVLHALLAASLLLLGAPWLLKGLGLVTVLVRAVALAPGPTLRIVYRSDGRVALPDLGLDDLVLGPRTRYTTSWVRFDLRGGPAAVDILLTADQVDPGVWRALQAELRRIRPAGGNAAAVK